jgi:hypothetical protein
VANVVPGQTPLSHASSALSAYVHTAGADSADAAKLAYAIIYRNVILQATTLAYLDTFLVLATIGAIMFVLSFTLRKNDPGARRVVVE